MDSTDTRFPVKVLTPVGLERPYAARTTVKTCSRCGLAQRRTHYQLGQDRGFVKTRVNEFICDGCFDVLPPAQRSHWVSVEHPED